MGAFVVDSKRRPLLKIEILFANLFLSHGAQKKKKKKKKKERRLRKVEWRGEKMGKKEEEKGGALFATAASRYVGGIGGQGI